MSEVKTHYDDDFVAWTKEQADALRTAARTASNQALDWENLAEEVESLGISERRELHSQVQRIIRHLLKLQFSPASEPRRRWFESISDARSEIEIVLRMSPSLRSEIDSVIAEEDGRAIRRAVSDLEEYGEITRTILAAIRKSHFTSEQILDDWFPPAASP